MSVSGVLARTSCSSVGIWAETGSTEQRLRAGGAFPWSLSIIRSGVALLAIISPVRSPAGPPPRHISLCQFTCCLWIEPWSMKLHATVIITFGDMCCFGPETPSTNVTSYSGTSADRKKICGFVKREGVSCYFEFRKWRLLHFTYLNFKLDTFSCSPPGAAKGKKATHRFNTAKSIISLYEYLYNMAVWLDLFVISLMVYDV